MIYIYVRWLGWVWLIFLINLKKQIISERLCGVVCYDNGESPNKYE